MKIDFIFKGNKKMKNEQFKIYLYVGLTIFLALGASILLFFVLDKMSEIQKILSVISNAAKPLIYGAVIAYLLYPICIFFEKFFAKLFKKMKNKKVANKLIRFLSITISFIVGISLVGVILYMVIPQVYESIVSIINSIPAYIEKLSVLIDNKLSNNTELNQTVHKMLSQYTNDIVSILEGWSGQIGLVVKSIGDGVLSVFVVTKNIFIGIIVAIYLLADRHKFKIILRRFIDLIFKRNAAKAVKDEIKYANDVILNFISGRILDSAIIGVLCYIIMLVLKLPYPLLISVLVGITNIIPFFGPFLGAIPSAVIILIVSPIQCIIFIVMIFILQQIDGNIIGPRVVGESIGLSSFWVLFSILIFSGLFGITGMLIGVPVFAIIYDIIKKSVAYFENKKAKSEEISTKNS